MNDLRPNTGCPNTGCPNTGCLSPEAVKSNRNPKGCP
ncbi:MAG: hypothetical protein RLZZ362_2372 [Actinomycetota bacterium]|jgi:hypothetical protein